MKNIETSFRHLRLFGIVYLGVCTLLVGYSVWKAYSFAEAQRQKIYVLDEGKSLMLALSQDLEQNRPVEAREHVRRFHELFFTLAPDKSAIEGNVQRAMFLSDRSAYSHYGDLTFDLMPSSLTWSMPESWTLPANALPSRPLNVSWNPLPMSCMTFTGPFPSLRKNSILSRPKSIRTAFSSGKE